MQVLVARERRVNLLTVRDESRGLLFHVSYRAVAIRARDRSGLYVWLGRWCVIIVSSLDISGGIAPRDRDPRVSGQRSPSQRWDRREYSIFLHTLVHARRASIIFRELHGHLPLHRQAGKARLWAEAEDEAHRLGR